MVYSRTNKTLGLPRKLQNLLPRSALITIYKAFVRTHVYYGDIFYGQAYTQLKFTCLKSTMKAPKKYVKHV